MAFIAAALLASCSDDKDYSGDFGQIKVPDTRQLEQTVSADDTQSARGVTFTTEGAWTSTIAETRAEAPAWISISPDRGDAAGSYTLKITLEPNTSGASRTATIVITCGTSKIEITVTQEGADDPIESTPANRIMRIDSRQQTIRNSGDSDPERWTSTSRFTYDDAGLLTCYEWDDTPENSADAMDEVLRISYPDAKTLKLSAETTESPEKGSYTVTLDDAGRAVAARSDNGPERWTFAYDGNGCCKECTYSGDEYHYYPRTVCRWTGNDLTGLDIYQGKEVDFSYEFEYHADRPNTPALCNLDLNALLFDVCPDIEDADFFMGSVLSGIGRLGNRSAHLTNTNPDESVFSVESLPDGSFISFRVLNEQIEWKQVGGRVTEAIWIQEVECFQEKTARRQSSPNEATQKSKRTRSSIDGLFSQKPNGGPIRTAVHFTCRNPYRPISPSRRNEKSPSRAMMMWSSSRMSNNAAARATRSVSVLSCPLASGVPEGWLCTRISCVASSSNARLTISRWSTTVPVTPP